jgi:predicted peptidase
MKKLFFLLIVISFSTSIHAQLGDSSIVAKFERHSFAQDTTALNYRLFKPAVTDDSKNYPLILTLHGAGERGHDNEKQIAWHGIATAWADSASQERNPCFIISPQCPEENRWVDANWKPGMYDQDTVQMSNELETAHQLIQNLVCKISNRYQSTLHNRVIDGRPGRLGFYYTLSEFVCSSNNNERRRRSE